MTVRQIGFADTELSGGFLARIGELNETTAIGAVYDRFSETGRFAALACGWKEGDPFRPHIFWDSDVAKWIEAASYVLAVHPDLVLSSRIESVIDDIEANQWDDGYINSYYTAVEPQNRFTVRGNHELYCCGHMIEAAVAYYEATGRDRFLRIMMRCADLIDRVFRVERSAPFATPGHEEIELALFRLYRCTKKEKYLTLARYFVDARGTNSLDMPVAPSFNRLYQQDVPARDADEAVGHSVRACYFYAAMADYALETGDAAMEEACVRLWDDIVMRKMYITGGIGSTCFGEAFTVSYDLPSESAYTETCAGIGLIYFSQRMFLLKKQAKYADVIERLLYNGVISGLSLSGDRFFYENPLEINLRNRRKIRATSDVVRLPAAQREKVFGCSCCPPNINRLLASLGNYIYAAEDGEIYVNQFAPGRARDGMMKIETETDYPLTGRVSFRTENVRRLHVRIPGWCRSFTASEEYVTEGGYAVFSCPEVTVKFDMPVETVCADPRVWDNAGKVAVTRGPVVYCAEGRDNHGGDLRSFSIPKGARDSARVLPGGASGLPELELRALVRSETSRSGGLYYPSADAEYREAPLRLIPYFSFANRGEDDMLVWFTGGTFNG